MKRFIALTIILIISFVFSACSQSLEAKYDKAIRQLNKKDYTNALKLFEELGTFDDSLEYSQYTSALILMDRGEYEGAWQTFNDLDGFKQSEQYSQYLYALYISDSDAQSYETLLSLDGFLDSSEQAIKFENTAEMMFPVGSTFYFGSYEQDNKLDNGSEPIQWRIVEYEYRNAVLVSEYILDGGYTYYDISSFVHDIFYHTAFTAEEQEFVLALGIPSVSMIRDWMPNENDRIAYATNYANNQGVVANNHSINGSCWWWTDTVEYGEPKFVYGTGGIDTGSDSSRGIGIRPYIMLDMQAYMNK